MTASNGTPNAEGLDSQGKRALLARLLEEKARRDGAVAPLSFGQKALWYLHQVDPESPAYNEAITCRFHSPIDVQPIILDLFQLLVARHPALRTTFHSERGEPCQKIHTALPLSLPAIDAGGWTAEDLQQALREEARRPFDLERGPLFRLALFRRPRQEAVLLLAFHHVAIDLWSIMLLMSELRTMAAARLGTGAVPPPPSANYRDFVAWQARMLQGSESDAHWDYWSQQLSGPPPALELPADRPRPAVFSFRGAHHTFRLSGDLTDRLRALARREQTTLFTLLLAAFQVLLGRFAGQSDVVVGSLVSGRSRPEWERVVGFYANMVPLRADLSNDLPFRAFLARTRQTVLDAMTHQDFPFAVLVERLLPHRDPSRAPLCSTTFVLQQPRPLDVGEARPTLEIVAPAERSTRTSIDGLVGEMAPLDLGIVKSDLELEMSDASLGLGGCLSYSTDLFDAVTIDRMVGSFEVLLDGLVRDLDTPLSALPLLSGDERQRLLVEWNGKEVDYPRDRLVPELIEDLAERTPDAPAVACGDEELTFREFNARANQLAGHLQTLGVGPGIRVGICLPRSLDVPVSLLAVLKAGGVYVPLDPASPPQRSAFVLEDAQVAVLLTHHRLLDCLPTSGPRVLCLDAETEAIARHGSENLPSVIRREHLAYVIYTSGSTGAPKGVAVSHGALSSHCHAFADRFGLRADDRVLQLAALTFDMAVEEMFPSWTSGACVVLGAADELALADFLAEVERQRLSVISVPAPYWHEWVAQLQRLPNPVPSSLRVLGVGSDTVSAERLVQWQRHVGGRVRVLSGYGPTEATVTATIYEPDLDSALSRVAGASVPIGKPLANTRVYVLDEQMRLVPVGVAGELCVGGERLSEGYLNQPGRTAERFVADPFRAGERVYRTGDRARWLADGNLEFLGRLDDQVKLRGFRIEPGEIEAALFRHPEVRQAVVIVREDVPGQRRLVAYIVGSDRITDAELRAFLIERLPSPMVPEAFVRLDALPPSPHGKVDRRKLPAPPREGRADRAPPRNAVEEVLAGIWAGVLDREVGIHDDFFAAGGHSLVAIQLVTQVRDALRVELSLRRMFEAPTVAGMAAALLADPASRDRVEKTAELLLHVARLSEEETERLLANGEGAAQ